MPLNLKKIVATTLLAALLQPIGLAFADPSTVFSNLMSNASLSISKPGYFNSQAEHVYSGGSLAFHVPSQSVQLISITPPTMDAGCGGIDLNLGGFNIISGANFAAFIQSAAQSAEGYVIMLGIKTLCPQCAAVLSEIHQLAEEAAKASANSCSIGSKLAADAFSLAGGPMAADPQQQFCAKAATATGTTDNPLDASTGVACGTLSAVSGFFSRQFPLQSPSQQARSPIVGNYGWIALTSLGMSNIGEMEFMLSLTGTVATTSEGTCTQTGGGSSGNAGCLVTTYYPPTLGSGAGTGVNKAMDMLMCGAGGSASPQDFIASYCGSVLPAAAVPTLWYCTDIPPALSAMGCMHMTYGPPNAAAKLVGLTTAGNGPTMVGYTGFLQYVYNLLEAAQQAVVSNVAIDPQFIALANVSPVPIYKIIDIAAVYPTVSETLIENTANLIASLIAEAYMRQIIEAGARTYTSTSAILTPSMGPSPLPASSSAAMDSAAVPASSVITTAPANWLQPAGAIPAQASQPAIDTLYTPAGGPDSPLGAFQADAPSTLTSAPVTGVGVESSAAVANQKFAKEMSAELAAIDNNITVSSANIAVSFALQASLLSQIRDIDQQIQTHVMHQGLLGNGWLSTRMLTPGVQAANGAGQAAGASVITSPTSGNTKY